MSWLLFPKWQLSLLAIQHHKGKFDIYIEYPAKNTETLYIEEPIHNFANCILSTYINLVSSIN